MREMKIFRHKETEVRAILYLPDGSNAEDVIREGGGAVCRGPRCGGTDENPVHRLWVTTVSGPVMLELGDWLVEGTLGERYPVKAEIFDRVFEEPRPFSMTPHPEV